MDGGLVTLIREGLDIPGVTFGSDWKGIGE